jgi:multidrug efflux pump subunit AcrB
MQEVQGALVAIVLVLCAVFVPVAFLGGIAGQLVQTVCGHRGCGRGALRRRCPDPDAGPVRPAAQGAAHRAQASPLQPLFERFTRSYTSTVGLTLKHGIIGGIIFALVIASTVAFFRIIPGSFVPAEDQGYLISALMLPDGATLKRTQKTGEDMRQMVAKDPAVKHTFVVSGFDLIGGGNKPNAGTIFIPLKDWSEREAKAQDLAGKFMGMGMMQGDGMALVFNPPPIMGLGTAGGFEVYVQNRIDGDAKKLNEVTQSFIAALQTHPEFTRISTFFRPPCRSFLSKSTKPKRWRSAFRWPAFMKPCKAPWARSTSMTSTRRAGFIACSCRPKPATA